jgi:hypothetical protein
MGGPRGSRASCRWARRSLPLCEQAPAAREFAQRLLSRALPSMNTRVGGSTLRGRLGVTLEPRRAASGALRSIDPDARGSRERDHRSRARRARAAWPGRTARQRGSGLGGPRSIGRSGISRSTGPLHSAILAAERVSNARLVRAFSDKCGQVPTEVNC